MNSEYSRLVAWVPVCVLLVVFFLIADYSAVNKSTTFDETAHITAGYANWQTGDFRLNPQNGLFSQMWLTLPLSGYEFPDQAQSIWEQADIWSIGDQFLHQRHNDVTSILTKTRRMNIVLGLFLGVGIFLWSKSLWGYHGGLLSLGLYTFSPLVLAHSRLATSDIAASLGFLLALTTTWKLIHGVSAKHTVLAGLSLGLLALSKMSVILMIPVIALMLLINLVVGQKAAMLPGMGREYSPAKFITIFTAIVAMTIIAIAVIWVPHIFANTQYPFDWRILDRASPAMGALLSAFRQLHLLPESYMYGLAFVLSHASDRLVFAAGQFSVGGFWWFFPFAVLVKTPVTTLLCILISMVLIYRLKQKSVATLYQASPLIVFIAVYVSMAMISGLNIGLRHLLPVYPMVFILCGVLVQRVTIRKLSVLIVILAVLLLETLSVHPHYLSYFNQLSGGPAQGYRLLVDSSNDWGQDLPGLAKWQEVQGPDNRQYLAYFGTANPASYGIQMKRLPGFLDRHYESDWQSLTAGTYIISATLLQVIYQPDVFGHWTAEQEKEYTLLRNFFLQDKSVGFRKANASLYKKYEKLRFARLCRYLRQRNPDEMIGYSLLVYHLDEEDIRQAL